MIILFIAYLYCCHLIGDTFKGRKDTSPLLDYYRAKDLNLEDEPFSFRSGRYLLRGSKYYKKGQTPKALIVFFHGLGSNRRSYLHLISKLVFAGYVVMAYDGRGVNESEGIAFNGLGQAIKDSRAFINFLAQDKEMNSLPRFAVGHSWGGYCALSCLEPSLGFSKVASFSGFLKPSKEILSVSPDKRVEKAEPLVSLYLLLHFGRGSNFDVTPLIRTTKIPTLYIQGDKDPAVPYRSNGKVIESINNPFVSTFIVPNRKHQIYLTPKAESLVDELFWTSRDIKASQNTNLDLQSLCEEDPIILKRLIDFLNK